jgi:hypothetical protein
MNQISFNARTAKYDAVVESTICGIPCLIGVTYYESINGSYSYNAASDMDYYGYSESEYDVLDRKGYRAKWLERKVTEDDTAQIDADIHKYYH